MCAARGEPILATASRTTVAAVQERIAEFAARQRPGPR
jgi:hypothetical protein